MKPRADLGFCGSGGFARPVGIPGFSEEGVVNQAYGYSSFLKDGGSFIT